MNTVFYYIIHIVLFLASWIVPKKPGLMVFGAGRGTAFKGNTKYLYLYVNESRPDLTPLWLTRSTHIYDQLKEKKLPVVRLDTLQSIWNILRAEYICIEQSAKDIAYAGILLGRFRIVQTWHGTPLKKIAADTFSTPTNLAKRIYRALLLREFKNYVLIPSPAPEVSPLLSSGLGNNQHVQVMGYPRNDVLLAPERAFTHLKSFVKQHVGSRKIIAYIPTFRDAESTILPFSDSEWKQLDEWLSQNEYTFVVKKHPFQKTLAVPADAAHIVDLSSEIDDIQEFLPYVDILITDYSSVYFDFMITKRPVLFYAYDLEQYLSKSRAMYYTYEEAIPGPVAASAQELIQLLESHTTWFPSQEYQNSYNTILNRFNTYTDVLSSERIINHLYPHASTNN